MNILIIGNGFDIAHGLPTTYKEFLVFARCCIEVFQKNEDDPIYYDKLSDATEIIFGNIIKNDITTNESIKEMIELLEDNIWFRYFIKKYEKLGENWIDFESEIKYVIECVDTVMSEVKVHNKKNTGGYNIFGEYLRVF